MSVRAMSYNVRVRRILVLGVCVLALTAAAARGGGPAAQLPLPCGLPPAQPLWVDYADGGVPFWSTIFARPGIVGAASNLLDPAAAPRQGRANRLLRPLSEQPGRNAVEARRPGDDPGARRQALRRGGRIVGLRPPADGRERALRRAAADAVDGDDRAVPRERARLPATSRRARRPPVPAALEYPVHPRRDRRCVVAAGRAGRRPRPGDLLLRPRGLEAGRGRRQPHGCAPRCGTAWSS